MLCLRDVVEIDATPECVFDWFRHLDVNYRSWHPNHVSCRFVRGRGLESGAVLYAEEYLHGRLHRLRFTLEEVDPGRELKFKVFPGLRGVFRMRPTDRGTELVAELLLGLSIPVLGPFVDRVIQSLFRTRIDALRRHMHEEGVQLRALLSTNDATTRAI